MTETFLFEAHENSQLQGSAHKSTEFGQTRQMQCNVNKCATVDGRKFFRTKEVCCNVNAQTLQQNQHANNKFAKSGTKNGTQEQLQCRLLRVCSS